MRGCTPIPWVGTLDVWLWVAPGASRPAKSSGIIASVFPLVSHGRHLTGALDTESVLWNSSTSRPCYFGVRIKQS